MNLKLNKGRRDKKYWWRWQEKLPQVLEKFLVEGLSYQEIELNVLNFEFKYATGFETFNILQDVGIDRAARGTIKKGDIKLLINRLSALNTENSKLIEAKLTLLNEKQHSNYEEIKKPPTSVDSNTVVPYEESISRNMNKKEHDEFSEYIFKSIQDKDYSENITIFFYLILSFVKYGINYEELDVFLREQNINESSKKILEKITVNEAYLGLHERKPSLEVIKHFCEVHNDTYIKKAVNNYIEKQEDVQFEGEINPEEIQTKNEIINDKNQLQDEKNKEDKDNEEKVANIDSSMFSKIIKENSNSNNQSLDDDKILKLFHHLLPDLIIGFMVEGLDYKELDTCYFNQNKYFAKGNYSQYLLNILNINLEMQGSLNNYTLDDTLQMLRRSNFTGKYNKVVKILENAIWSIPNISNSVNKNQQSSKNEKNIIKSKQDSNISVKDDKKQLLNIKKEDTSKNRGNDKKKISEKKNKVLNISNMLFKTDNNKLWKELPNWMKFFIHIGKYSKLNENAEFIISYIDDELPALLIALGILEEKYNQIYAENKTYISSVRESLKYNQKKVLIKVRNSTGKSIWEEAIVEGIRKKKINGKETIVMECRPITFWNKKRIIFSIDTWASHIQFKAQNNFKKSNNNMVINSYGNYFFNKLIVLNKTQLYLIGHGKENGILNMRDNIYLKDEKNNINSLAALIMSEDDGYSYSNIEFIKSQKYRGNFDESLPSVFIGINSYHTLSKFMTNQSILIINRKTDRTQRIDSMVSNIEKEYNNNKVNLRDEFKAYLDEKSIKVPKGVEIFVYEKN